MHSEFKDILKTLKYKTLYAIQIIKLQRWTFLKFKKTLIKYKKSEESNWSSSRVISISSLLQDVTLHKAESPWRPNRNAFLQILIKRVRSILNKLTPQNFQTLVKELSEMEINTEESLSCVVGLIFETVSLSNDKVSNVLCILRGAMNN